MRHFFNPLMHGLLFLLLIIGGVEAHADIVIEKENGSLNLETNKGVLIRLDRPATNIFIANPKIADVQIKSPRLIYVFGQSTGETTLFAVDKDEQIIYSTSIHITENLTRLQGAIDSLLPNAKIDIESINGMIILSGFSKSLNESETAERMVRNTVGKEADILNRIKVTTPTQVNLRVKIAEVSREVLKTIGFNWDASLFGDQSFFGFTQGSKVFQTIEDTVTGNPIRQFLTGNGGTNSLIGNLSGNNFDLNSVIDALETEGYLSVLAEPNLTALSGETATFLAGGEFPIPVPNQGDISIEFKQFGVGLTFTPNIISENRINLKVAPEVSQLSNTGAIRINNISVPSLTTRKASTTVELASGQSFAIAGLLQNNFSEETSKFPGLGDLPIIGALFRSEKFKRNETELVIIITPYIVTPINAEIRLPTDNQRIPSDRERFIAGKNIITERAPPMSPTNQNKALTIPGGAGFRIKD